MNNQEKKLRRLDFTVPISGYHDASATARSNTLTATKRMHELRKSGATLTLHKKELNDLKAEIKAINGTIQEFYNIMKETSLYGGEGNVDNEKKIDELNGRVSNLEVTVGRMDERTKTLEKNLESLDKKIDKKFDSLEKKVETLPSLNDIKIALADESKKKPDTNDVKVLISDELVNKKMTSETFVESKVNAAKNTIIRTVIVTGIAAAGAIFVIARYFTSAP